jgi:competence protein ComEC
MSSLLIQLCITPQAISSVGFQLSYAAMAGIAFIYPWIRNFWPGKGRDGFFRNHVRWIWDSAALSISCQLATGPLVYLYFGSIPKHFIMTNLAALPLTGLLIPSAVATVILNHTGICPDILIRITEKLADLLTGCLETIACM